MNDLVYMKNDEAVCDSLQVAEKFGKRHADVIRSEKHYKEIYQDCKKRLELVKNLAYLEQKAG